MRKAHNFLDLTNKKFGRLVVIRETDRKNKWMPYWECRCDCGTIHTVKGNDLRNGKTKSCGCLKARPLNTKHIGDVIFNTIYSKYLKNSIKKAIKFELSRDAVKKLLLGECFYCKTPPKQTWFSVRRKAHEGQDFFYNGIDKLTPDIGYVEGNVVSCCKDCNSLKSHRTYQEFVDIIRRVYKHHGS